MKIIRIILLCFGISMMVVGPILIGLTIDSALHGPIYGKAMSGWPLTVIFGTLFYTTIIITPFLLSSWLKDRQSFKFWAECKRLLIKGILIYVVFFGLAAFFVSISTTRK